MDAFVSVVQTLLNLALQAFSLFLQLIVAILTFFLEMARMVLSALHLM